MCNNSILNIMNDINETIETYRSEIKRQENFMIDNKSEHIINLPLINEEKNKTDKIKTLFNLKYPIMNDIKIMSSSFPELMIKEEHDTTNKNRKMENNTFYDKINY
ncbi:hypothetical protein TCON_0444 [Astathelohania contejeani]|uniref:Uncharacterized protein n=1 Tax=Astathelohania contejeani TaxID=164912 RepID=A0ABQ7I1U5_9MICR|nr:hypothetical protein TCON_0444 [Thelohania contejeani]